jgi:hypothetical protein
MSTKRIPQESWKPYFDTFSRQHHGWLVTVDTGAGRVAEEEPLDSIRSTREGIEIDAGHSHYRVARPSIVTVTTAGNDRTAVDHLEIESGSEKLTLRFRAVINPELVDGMV